MDKQITKLKKESDYMNIPKVVFNKMSIEDNIEIAEPETADSYSGQFKLRLPKTLHKILAEDSKKEGVSMNQYCVYLLAKNSEKEHISIAKKQSVLV